MAENFRPDGVEQEFAPKKPKLVIVENSEAREQKARDVADSKMAENLEDEPKGFFKKLVSKSFWKNTGKKIWKHNLWSDVYRQKYISEARKNIGEGESANLYANEFGSDNKIAHQKADKALVDRFMMVDTQLQKDMIHSAAGEKGEVLGDYGEEGKIKMSLQAALKEYAAGRIDEVAFLDHKTNILGRLKKSRGDIFDKGQVYADNLLEVAKWARSEVERQVAQSISQAEALRNLDLDLDVVIGKAKSGVRTEAQFNSVDRIVDKIQSSWLGRYVSHDVTSTAVAIATSVVTGASKASARIGSKLAGFAGGLAVGAGLAGLRESRKLEIERAQHAREKAQGKEVAIPTKAERRNELETSRIVTKSAEELILALNNNLNIPGKELKDFNEAEIKTLVEQIGEIDARVNISDDGIKNKDISNYRLFNRDKRFKVDLISFSNITKVEEERNRLDIARATAKIKLKKVLEDKGVLDFETILQSAATSKEIELMQGDKGILEQNKKFTEYKRAKVASAVFKRLLIGGAVGLAVEEAKGMFDGRGILGGFAGPRADHEVTPLEGTRRWLWNYAHGTTPHPSHAPGFHEFDISGHHFKFPNGIELKPDGHGGYNLVDDGKIISDPSNPLHLDAKGNFDADSLKYLGDHGFSPHETIAAVHKGFQHDSSAETLKKFPGLAKHNRIDWHDEPGKFYSKIHKAFLEFEGKQQMGILEQVNGHVYLNVGKVIKNFQDQVINDWFKDRGQFGTVEGYFTDPSEAKAFVDTKFEHMFGADAESAKIEFLTLMSELKDLRKEFQAVIIPTDGANHDGLNDLMQGADANNRILLENGSAGVNWSKYFTDPKQLQYEHHPFRFIEMRFKGHVLGTSIGLPDTEKIVTTLIDHPPTENIEAEDFDVEPPLPFILGGRRPLEAMRPEVIGYGYGYLSEHDRKQQEEIFKKYRSKTLEQDPFAKLNHFKETESYFKRQDKKYLKELKELSLLAGPMLKDNKLSVCIPVAGHQESKQIYSSLESYLGQTASKKDFEIVLYVNHPKTDKAGHPLSAEKTLAEIERFKKDHPEMQVTVVHQALEMEQANIRHIRKVLNDLTLYRHHQRGDTAPDLIMVSNDADNNGIAPEYIQNFITKFGSSPRVEAYLGQLDWNPEGYTMEPLVHIGTRLFQYLGMRGRRMGSGRMSSSGANFAFRSSIYAGVGGYIEELPQELGEDIAFGRAIEVARHDDIQAREDKSIKFAGARVSRVYTSARRALHRWQRFGLAPINQWNKGFSAFDNEVREIVESGGKTNYDDPEVLRKFKLGLEEVINQTLDEYTKDPDISVKNHPIYIEMIGRLGIKYELDGRGNVVVTDMTKLVEGLKEYQEYALSQRKAKSGDSVGLTEFKTIRKKQNLNRTEKSKIEEEAFKKIEEEADRKIQEFYTTDNFKLENLPTGFSESDVVSDPDLEDLDLDYEMAPRVVISNKETAKVFGGMKKADKKLIIVKQMSEKQVKDAAASSFRSKDASDVEAYLLNKGLKNRVIQVPERVIKRANEQVRIYEAGLQDLEEYLLSGNTLSPKQAVSLIIRIADGVRELHKLEVVHGDISPSNIILFKDGVKLGDLDGASVDSTGKGFFGRRSAIGNRFVMAPEMFKALGRSGNISYGKTADIYEVGITLFRLLAGKWPYDLEGTRKIRKMKGDEKMPLYAKLHKEGKIDFPDTIPTGLQNVIRKAMAPKATDRYSSMNELTSALVDAYQNL